MVFPSKMAENINRQFGEASEFPPGFVEAKVHDGVLSLRIGWRDIDLTSTGQITSSGVDLLLLEKFRVLVAD